MRTLAWRRSSYSTSATNCVEVAPAWLRSSYSSTASNCVEVGPAGPAVAVRDSKNPDGGTLLVPAASWATFVSAALVSGEVS